MHGKNKQKRAMEKSVEESGGVGKVAERGENHVFQHSTMHVRHNWNNNTSKTEKKYYFLKINCNIFASFWDNEMRWGGSEWVGDDKCNLELNSIKNIFFYFLLLKFYFNGQKLLFFLLIIFPWKLHQFFLIQLIHSPRI